MLAAALALAALAAGALGAQQPAAPAPDSEPLDSLRARLERAEQAIALLREQLAVESEGAVHTRSRVHVELTARLLTNAFATWGRVNNQDVPLTALPPSPTAATQDALGVTLRQTRVGGATTVDDVLGGTFSGDVDFDLFGGVQNGPGDRRLFPEPRLRTARARITWRRTELMFGADQPLVSDLNPVSLAAIGYPEFSGAGNLWNWLGQLRVARELGDVGPLRVAIQGAVMAPYTATVAPGEPDATDAGDRSRRPALEARLRARWGEDDTPLTEAGGPERGGEIGVGLHRGWVATAPGVLLESRAVALDGRAALGAGVELRGEAYAGRLLRGLGGGAIAQNFGAPAPGAPAGTLGAPVRDVAGWLQLNVQPLPVLSAGIGCGIDLVNPRDDPARLQNTVCAAHAEWRPAQPLVFGAEYRQLGTRYPGETYGARHLNLVFGVEL